MFAIKIENGKERIRVRHYNNGFLPSYTSAGETTMGKRLFVVPGYIFTMTRVNGAEKVPDAEWKVIEAISDSHQSTLDTKTQKITDGPLKGLLILQINPTLKSVCIRAKLLGVTRDYWLAVKFKDDEKTENVVKSDKNAEEVRKMAKATYTDEQLNEALEKAKEIGIHAAGAATGVPWQAIMSAAKKAGVEITPKVVKKKKAKSAPASTLEPASVASTPTTSDAGRDDTEKNKVEKDAVEKTEKPKRGRKKKAVYEVVSTTPATPTTPVVEEKVGVEKKAAPEKAENELMVENAVLRKENEQLKAKIEKLQKALADLIY